MCNESFIFKGSHDNSYFSQIFTSKRLARFALQSYLALVNMSSQETNIYLSVLTNLFSHFRLKVKRSEICL